MVTFLTPLASNSEWPKGSIGRAFAVRIRTENRDQAGICPFALREVSVLPEPALGHLRYHLTDVPPQSNSPPDIVPQPGYGCRLEIQYRKGGIPTSALQRLASLLHCLPPILYMQHRIPVSSWSKAPWGLSVLAQVTSIFTGISISPGALSRQRSNHYAFRAGRNLPDKEFRYLRTVIVTAAVYWGLNSELRVAANPSS